MNRAARVASAATSGRLLVTAATWGQALLLERQQRLMQPLQQQHTDCLTQHQQEHLPSHGVPPTTKPSLSLPLPVPLHQLHTVSESLPDGAMPTGSTPPLTSANLSSSPLTRLQVPPVRFPSGLGSASGDISGGGGSTRPGPPGSPSAVQANNPAGTSAVFGGNGLSRLFRRPSNTINNNSSHTGLAHGLAAAAVSPSNRISAGEGVEGATRGAGVPRSASTQMTAESSTVTACHSGSNVRALTATSLGKCLHQGCLS
jgi:hypothetical protein